VRISTGSRQRADHPACSNSPEAKIKAGDLLEVVVDTDGTIRLVPRLAVDRALAEKYQLEDAAWALKQKDNTGLNRSVVCDTGPLLHLIESGDGLNGGI